MKHIELHSAHTPRDLTLLATSGLPVPHDLNPGSCRGCKDPVGESGRGGFSPLVVALSDDGHWYLCLDCAGPALG